MQNNYRPIIEFPDCTLTEASCCRGVGVSKYSTMTRSRIDGDGRPARSVARFDPTDSTDLAMRSELSLVTSSIHSFMLRHCCRCRRGCCRQRDSSRGEKLFDTKAAHEETHSPKIRVRPRSEFSFVISPTSTAAWRLCPQKARRAQFFTARELVILLGPTVLQRTAMFNFFLFGLIIRSFEI